jgi:hypothetical protein
MIFTGQNSRPMVYEPVINERRNVDMAGHLMDQPGERVATFSKTFFTW